MTMQVHNKNSNKNKNKNSHVASSSSSSYTTSSSSSSSSSCGHDITLFDIPLDLWGCIFSYCDSVETAIALRQVCHQIKQKVDCMFWHNCYFERQMRMGKCAVSFDLVLDNPHNVQNKAFLRLLQSVRFPEFPLDLDETTIAFFMEEDKTEGGENEIHVAKGTRFLIEDFNCCTDWSMVPTCIRHQTKCLSTSTVLSNRRLDFMVDMFPNLTSIVVTRTIGKQEALLFQNWFEQTCHVDDDTDSCMDGGGSKKRKKHHIREIIDETFLEHDDISIDLPPYLHTFRSFVKHSLVSFPLQRITATSLTTLELSNCSNVISIGNLCSLKTLIVRYCDRLQRLETSSMQSLTNVHIVVCRRLEKQLTFPSSLLHLTLEATAVQHIVKHYIVDNGDGQGTSTSSYKQQQQQQQRRVVLKTLKLLNFDIDNTIKCPRFSFVPETITQKKVKDEMENEIELVVLDSCCFREFESRKAIAEAPLPDNEKTMDIENATIRCLDLVDYSYSIIKLVGLARLKVRLIRPTFIVFPLSMTLFQKTLHTLVLQVDDDTPSILITDLYGNKCLETKKTRKNINWRYRDFESSQLYNGLLDKSTTTTTTTTTTTRHGETKKQPVPRWSRWYVLDDTKYIHGIAGVSSCVQISTVIGE